MLSAFFILIWIISCSPDPVLFDNKGQSSLKKKINRLLISYQKEASIGIDIRLLETGESIYSYHKSKLFTPASNAKLFTSGTALISLGLKYKFRTLIYQQGNNLVIEGGGDPDLTLKNLDSLAKLIALKFETIDTLIADESFFDLYQYGPGWMWDEGPWWHAAPVSALSLNDNCLTFFITPDKIGSPVHIEISPNTHHVKIVNESTTVSDSIDLKRFLINRDWKNQTNTFTITGNKVQSFKTDTLQRNVENPAYFTAAVLAKMLEEYKVPVNYIKTGKKPESAIPLFSNFSRPLLDLNKEMMFESHNLSAEILTKMISIRDSLPGNWKVGLEVMKSLLADSAGIDTSKIKLADGSGLSRYNLSSAQSFTQFLAYIYQSKYREAFISSLPYGGSISTLENRLANTGSDIRAKSGSLSGVSCLSGYIFSKQYGPVAFSILINGFIGSSLPYIQLQDKIVTLLRHH